MMVGDQNYHGGPAFPRVLYSHERAENWSTDGMSLRDWFAGQALAAIIAQGCSFSVETMELEQARRCYAFADAMLAVRAKDQADS